MNGEHIPEYESGRAHVLDAARINGERGSYYAEVTGGKSTSLTRRLVLLERLSAIPLALFDLWGRKYNRQGIHIIEADFVPMTGIKEASAPLRFDGEASEEHRDRLGRELQAYREQALRSSRCGDFGAVASSTYELLQFVHEVEGDSRSLFPMTRHLLEFAGNSASNSITYAEQSRGRTTRLSTAFLLFQLFGIRVAMGIDQKAQACHALGAGIVENDIPFIQFEEDWRARSG